MLSGRAFGRAGQPDNGTVELVLSALTEGGDRFKCVGLLEDEYVAIPASDHPEAAAPELFD